MATTYKTWNGTGSKTDFDFQFPTFAETEVKVEVDGALQSSGYTIPDYTTANGGTVTFTTAPATGTQNVRVYRETSVASPRVDYQVGSAIRAQDLDRNQSQVLRTVEEHQEQIRLGATNEFQINHFEEGDKNDNSEIRNIKDGGNIKVMADEVRLTNRDDTRNLAQFIDEGAAKLHYNNSVKVETTNTGATTTGTHVATAFTGPITGAVTGNVTGNLTGNVTGNCSGSSGSTTGNAVTATTATNFTASANNSTNETVYPVFVDGATGAQGAETDTGFTYNPSTGNLTATKFTGAVTGNVTGDVTGNADTATTLSNASSITDGEHAGHTADNATYFTTKASDARFYRKGSADDIEAAGVPWSGNDSTVATTAAIDKRIIDLVDDVGGFVPIESENHFPNTNPDINDPATGGTIVSIASLSEDITTGSGVTSNNDKAQTIGGTAVTINGLTQNTTYPQYFGMLVETTSTLNTYNFHRLVPKATEVTVVAGKATEITTCHTKATEITTVAGIDTEVAAVAGKATEISRLGTTAAVADMALLGTADCVADMAILGTSDVVTDLNTLGTADIVSDLDTVATNITDVSNFADLYQIGTSAPTKDGGNNDLAAGDLWFDSSSNKALKVHNGTAFQAVSPTQAVLDDIAIVSGDLTRQEDLGSIADDLASPTTTSDLETCADNITNINTFANVYRIAANAPTSSLDEGDLWYDSTANKLKYYTGSAWTVTAGAGLSTVADDTSPELGGHLDCNNKNLTEVATVSGDNLQIDFGTIA